MIVKSGCLCYKHPPMKKAVIVFSGGLDSTTCLAYAKKQGFECYAITFNYQQKHNAEIRAAKKIAAAFSAQHLIIGLPVPAFQGSAMTSHDINVPDFKVTAEKTIPVTYVPARNTIFLSYALGWAETLQANDIFIGVSAVDYSGYPDCRPIYIETFQKLANLATKTGVEEGNMKIHAPLIHLSKAKTIELGLSLGIDYSMTVTCYRADDNGHACGTCESCYLRKKGFAELGVLDQTVYCDDPLLPLACHPSESWDPERHRF